MYQRLPLPIPLFLRGQDKLGQPFLDLTLALNVSAGGALLATLRRLHPPTEVTLEVPNAALPTPINFLQMEQGLKGQVIRTTDKGSYHLCAIRFARPLLEA
jgi:hypothetical protein